MTLLNPAREIGVFAKNLLVSCSNLHHCVIDVFFDKSIYRDYAVDVRHSLRSCNELGPQQTIGLMRGVKRRLKDRSQPNFFTQPLSVGQEGLPLVLHGTDTTS